jgi:hypothetical protein
MCKGKRKDTVTMMPMTIYAANRRFTGNTVPASVLQPQVRPAPPVETAGPSTQAQAPVTTSEGGGVRKAEGKQGETPDPTAKLAKLIAKEKKSMLKRKPRPVSSDSESDDY